VPARKANLLTFNFPLSQNNLLKTRNILKKRICRFFQETGYIAAVDFATAAETTADGIKRAEIKKAEGIRQARILSSEGEADAVRLVNEAADKYFVGNSQLLKRLETAQFAHPISMNVASPDFSIESSADALPLTKESNRPGVVKVVSICQILFDSILLFFRWYRRNRKYL
jgi:hypothetical protein